MPSIDWSQLGGISAPRVIGSVPAVPQDNSQNSLIGGIMQGMGQAQQMQADQTRNAYNQIILQQAKAQQAHTQALNQAYQQGGMTGYYNALNPDEKMNFDAMQLKNQESQAAIAEHIANIKEKGALTDSDLATTEKTKADTRGIDLKNEDAASLLQSRIYHQASMGKSPAEKEQIYQGLLSTMPKDLSRAFPQHYNDTMAMISMDQGQEVMKSQQQQAELKATENGKGNSDSSSFGKTFGTSPAEQKAVVDAETNSKNVVQGLRTANTLKGELNTIPDNAFNPATGELNAKYTAKGEAINKEINTLVTQAPSILGLPASALRAATVWKMVQNSKPTAKMWTVADKAMLDNIKYMGALQYHDNWKIQSDARQAQLISGDAKAQAEAKDWLAKNPDPLKENPMPDLTDFYKLFPGMKGQLESDWKTVQQNKLPGDVPKGIPDGVDPGLYQEMQKRGLIK